MRTGPFGAGGLGDGQRVHVRAQAQAAATAATHQPAHHAGAADTALHGVAPAFELVGHQRGRAVFLEGELGVAVDVAAQGNEFAHARLQGVQEVGHGGSCVTAAAG